MNTCKKYLNAKQMKKDSVREPYYKKVVNFIISEAIFISLTKTINIFRNLIKK